MLTETEIKIRLKTDDFDVVLQRCAKLYGEAIYTVQRDEYFDTQDEFLKSKDYTVRLRTVNNRTRIALKSPRGFLPHDIYSRLELEFSALSDEEVRSQLHEQSLIPTAVIEKRRWKFKGRTGLKVTIDELPFIGCFLEIEAESISRIEKVLEILQLSGHESERRNYTELMEHRLESLGLALRPALYATFDAEAQFLAAKSNYQL